MSSPFPLPMAFTAWETGVGGRWEGGSIGSLIAPCLEQGFRSVALQIAEVTREQVEWCQEKGLFVVLWDEVGAGLAAAAAELQPDGLCPQVEGPGQYDATVAALESVRGLALPKAIVTTYGGLVVLRPDGQVDLPATAAKWKRLAGLGAEAAYVECYASDDAVHADLDRMLAQGRVYGIPEADLFAVCGVFRGEMPAAYKGLPKLGRNFSVYIAEAMTETQWETWGEVAPAPTPTPTPTPKPKVPYWRLTAGRSLLHEERAKTYADGSTGLGKMLAWMKAHPERIRSAKSVDLDHVLR